jgi:rare lipoprotein A
MLSRPALPVAALLLLVAAPARSQPSESDPAVLFSPAPMVGSFEKRFARDQTIAPTFTRPDVVATVSVLSSQESVIAASTPTIGGHKGAVAVLRELLLVPPAEGTPSSIAPSPQQQTASPLAGQAAVAPLQEQTGAPNEKASTTALSPGPLWTKRATPRITTRPLVNNARLLGIVQAAFYQHPGRTASGEKYNPNGLTAAHKTLPLGTRLQVVNQRNGRSVVVRINDRVPRQAKFPIDLSRGSARAIGMKSVAPVVLYAMR